MKEVILDHERSPSDPLHLPHQCFAVGRMMKNIDGHCHIVFPIRKRQLPSVKFADRDRSAGSNQHIHSFNSEIGPHVEKGLVQQTISASNVEHACRLG